MTKAESDRFTALIAITNVAIGAYILGAMLEGQRPPLAGGDAAPPERAS